MPFDEALLTPAFMSNPYPYYVQLREDDPIHWSPRLNAWILTRYADVHAALRDARLISGKRVESYAQSLAPNATRAAQPLYDQINKWIGNLDPPDHTRLRRLVNTAFTPRMVDRLRPRIEQLLDRLLDDAQRQGAFDFIAAIAYPLPAIVIAEMLGVPPQNHQRFMAWSDALTRYGGTGLADARTARQAGDAARELTEFFRHLAAQRRTKPREDLISALVRAADEGERLTEQELLSTCGFLIVAGHETTMALLANAMLALLRHPDQLERLANDTTRIASAVEECLRFDSPIQHQTRVAAEDMQLHRRNIGKGQRVMPFLGAANRDPRQFPEPDRLDLGRSPNPHLAFGFGAHYCLGAPLARLEAQIALPTILRRLPNLKLDADRIEYRRHTSNRNPIAMPMKFSKATP